MPQPPDKPDAPTPKPPRTAPKYLFGVRIPMKRERPPRMPLPCYYSHRAKQRYLQERRARELADVTSKKPPDDSGENKD